MWKQQRIALSVFVSRENYNMTNAEKHTRTHVLGNYFPGSNCTDRIIYSLYDL